MWVNCLCDGRQDLGSYCSRREGAGRGWLSQGHRCGTELCRALFVVKGGGDESMVLEKMLIDTGLGGGGGYVCAGGENGGTLALERNRKQSDGRKP